MKWLADPINEFGRRCQSAGKLAMADRSYRLACWLAPHWGAPCFNRGLIAKWEHRWAQSFEHTLRSTELDPDHAPGWWNLGIAATAVGDWATARRAWTQYGIELPPGTGPIEMNLGMTPIRVAVSTAPEVVWCQRIDPARAIIRSVPLPGSQRAYQDWILHDGERVGVRQLGDHEVPVFNELEVLKRSEFSTFRVDLTIPNPMAAEALEQIDEPDQVRFEDWTQVEFLCVSCSEGRPHEHHAPPSPQPWRGQRIFGFSARDEAMGRDFLRQWNSAHADCEVHTVQCVLSR